MSRRNKKNVTPFHSYETDNKYDARYIRITHKLITSESFIKLSCNSKMIYIYMRDWAYPGKTFNFPLSSGKSIGINSPNTVIKCIRELEKRGFIDVVFSNKYSHEPNIYEFSDKWYKKFECSI